MTFDVELQCNAASTSIGRTWTCRVGWRLGLISPLLWLSRLCGSWEHNTSTLEWSLRVCRIHTSVWGSVYMYTVCISAWSQSLGGALGDCYQHQTCGNCYQRRKSICWLYGSHWEIKPFQIKQGGDAWQWLITYLRNIAHSRLTALLHFIYTLRDFADKTHCHVRIVALYSNITKLEISNQPHVQSSGSTSCLTRATYTVLTLYLHVLIPLHVQQSQGSNDLNTI